MSSVLDFVVTSTLGLTGASVGVFLARLTLITGLGCLALLLTRRAAPATRHQIAIASLAAALALPVAAVLLPSWSLPVLPQVAAPAPAPAVPAAPPVLDRAPREPAPEAGVPLPSAGHRGAGPRASESHRPRAAVSLSAPWAAVLLWILVAVTLFLRLAFSVLAGVSICRRAEAVTEPRLLAALARARARLRLDGTVALRTSPHVPVPAICGLRRPTLLLPAEACTWSDDRLHVVFLHELAHVRRRDGFTWMLARAATALLWFHPLVWILARSARRECERACDDMVLTQGVRASDYAEHLVSIARGVPSSDLANATLTLATRSSLERRLTSILHGGLRRGEASRRATVAGVFAASVVLVMTASIQLVAAPAPPTARERATEEETETTAKRLDLLETPSTSTRLGLVERSIEIPDAGSKETPQEDREEEIDRDAEPDPEAPDLERSSADAVSARSGRDWYSRARRLYERERYLEAGAAYESAARAGHNTSTALYNAACSYALAGRKSLALVALARALEEGFDSAELLASDSDLNSLRSDRRFALMLDRVRSSDAGTAKRRSAEAKHRSLRAAESTDEEDWKSVGMTLLRSGEYDLAADAFTRQHRIDGSASALYNRACAHSLGGETAEALAVLERAVLEGAGSSHHMRNDADLAPLHGQPEFERLVELADDFTLHHDGKDDEDQAVWRRTIARYQRVTREYPRAGRAWFNLGYVELRAGDANASTASFTRALELGHRPPTTMYNLACAAAQSGDRDAAFRWLARAEAAGAKLENLAEHDHDLDPLRSDPRFESLERRWERSAESSQHATTKKEKQKD
jgi:beta-lactamase regulating signal transducer with metallopeptidase domain/tetratricopeptide (TPR) repeat protein